ncbi:DNA replication licensing ATPase [Lactarius hatsudake]|nr:DNA replication licensing ATPase [Lactarius hatsudake]
MWRMASLKWRLARRQPRESKDETEVHVPTPREDKRTRIRYQEQHQPLFNEVVDGPTPIPTKDISEQDEVIDIIMHQQREQNEQIEGGQDGFSIHLLKRYNLYFKPLLSDVSMAVREVRGVHLGRLITARGIVTRVSEVKPLLLVNAYTCDVCGSETFQEISRKEFTPIADCQNENECKRNNIKGSLHIQTRACRFSPFQEVKIQEMADQVPVGHIPRSMTVHVNGTWAAFCSLFPTLVSSCLRGPPYRHLPGSALYSPTEEAKLAFSIAPEIYGHVDAKKALLLLLVDGVTKTMGDGMKIRGDLNVCLMGDPGGSSGVGLMAAVTCDPVTDEMVLEGGALVWADNGICGVDEFGKTIFISKAGTLNARTSILAAANPLYGRYNPKVSPVENINLPAALLSRFYLLLLLDKPSCDDDERLVQHITHVHMYNRHQDLEYEPLEPALMRPYIALARRCRPVVPPDVSSSTRTPAQPVQRRRTARRSHAHTSARTLLGVLRHAQAVARLRFAAVESLHDEDGGDADARDADRSDTSRVYCIINDMTQAADHGRDVQDEDGQGDCALDVLSIVDIRARVLRAGYTEAQLMTTIQEYEDLNNWTHVANGSKLSFA